jgi:Helix-turn-helix domain
MDITLQKQESSSPLVEDIWRSHSTTGGTFSSIAVTRSELVITRQQGSTSVMLRGPETRASIAQIPENAEFFGITFQLGVFIPAIAPTHLVDQHANLNVTGNSFWLHGQAIPIPDFEDTDVFIKRLIRLGLLRSEPTVVPMLNDEILETPSTVRTLQRRFLHSTGLSHRTVTSIERARQAVALLQAGLQISDVVHKLGYTDQPHLTKMLVRLVGRTPARIIHEAWSHSPLRTRELEQSKRMLEPELMPK